MVRRARRVQAELDALDADVAALRDEVTGTVRLGCIGTSARWLVPLVLEAVTAAHPKVHVIVVDATTNSLVPRLLADELDLAVVNLPVANPEVSTEPLFDEDRLLIAPDDHPLAGTSSGSAFADLADHDLLLEPSGTAFRDELDREAAAAGIELRAKAEVDGLRLIATLAFQGFGAAIVPATAAPDWLEGSWRRVPVDGLAPPLGGAGPALARPAPGARPRPARRRSSGWWPPKGPAPRACTLPRNRPPHPLSRSPHMTLTVPVASDHPGSLSAEITTVAGREVVLVQVTDERRRGALSEADGHTFAEAAEHAIGAGLPLLGVIASSGADVHDGVAALHGWGTAARALTKCSGRVPVLLAATGPGGVRPGAAARPGRPRRDDRGRLRLRQRPAHGRDLHRRVARQRRARRSRRPRIEHRARGAGGAGRRRGASTPSATCSPTSRRTSTRSHPAGGPTIPIDRPTPEAGACIPASPTGGYDVRDVIRAIVDDGELLELRARWAPNLVTAFATIGGRPVGIVANQPVAIAGTLDIPASQKGARFVSFCDAFGSRCSPSSTRPASTRARTSSGAGMIRHGAQLAFAYARATVPRVAVVLRKAYGGAYIVMDCRTMGSDLYLAWPSAEIAVMGAKGAVEILHRRQSRRGAAGARGRLRGALPQPVRRGRPRARRRGDRPGRHPTGGGRRHRAPRPPSASRSISRKHDNSPAVD